MSFLRDFLARKVKKQKEEFVGFSDVPLKAGECVTAETVDELSYGKGDDENE